MRNLILLLCILCGCKYRASGQLIPANVISHSIEAHFVSFQSLGKKICIADKTQKVIHILNSNYTIYKTLKIPFIEGYEMPIVSCITDKLFNSDTLIEFICQFNHNSNPKYETGVVMVFNEKGEKLLETPGYQYALQ